MSHDGENDKFAFYPLETRASLLRPPKTTKMTKMAGVTQQGSHPRKRKKRVSVSKTSFPTTPYREGALNPLLLSQKTPHFNHSTTGKLGLSEKTKGSDILFPYRSPSPRPHPTPRNEPETDPKQTRNGAKRSQTDPNGAKRSRNGPKSSPLPGGVCRDGGGGRVVREKENH